MEEMKWGKICIVEKKRRGRDRVFFQVRRDILDLEDILLVLSEHGVSREALFEALSSEISLSNEMIDMTVSIIKIIANLYNYLSSLRNYFDINTYMYIYAIHIVLYIRHRNVLGHDIFIHYTFNVCITYVLFKIC